MADIRPIGPGSEIDGFVIEGVAGQGGMGVVFRARQRRPDRIVALKVIAAGLAEDPMFGARFQRESAIAAEIEHPNVIPVHAVGEAAGVLYIAMRFVVGTDLRRLLARQGRLDQRRAVGIVDQVAQALDAAHARGLVHRDVKPANILISSLGDREHVYLSDFGISRHIEGSQGVTGTGAFVGTIDYVSPEQARGDRVDARSDVYSLGCVLFEALSGTVPFPFDNDLAKLYAHDSKPPPSVLERAHDVSPAFEPVLLRAMAKSRDDRYLSAGDLGRAAVAAVHGESLVGGGRSVAVGDAAPEGGTTVTSAQVAPSTKVAPTRRWAPAAATPVAANAGSTAAQISPPGRGRRRLLVAGTLAAAAAAAIIVAAAGGGGTPGRAGSRSAAKTTPSFTVPGRYPTLQAAVNAARSGQTIRIAPGSFSQQITIGKTVTLKGAGVASTTVIAPASLAPGPLADQRSIVTVDSGAKVTLEDLTIAGPRNESCGSPGNLDNGVLVAQNAMLALRSAAVSNVRDTPPTCIGPESEAIAIGSTGAGGAASPGHATIANDVISGYGDAGVDVTGPGSSATITGTKVIGLGDSAARIVRGILVHIRAKATISGDTITDNRCTSAQGALAVRGKPCGSDPIHQSQDMGVLVGKGGPGTVITDNTLSGNDIGIEVFMSPLCCTISHNRLTGNLLFGDLVRDGGQTVTGDVISGARVGVGVAADKSNATATLRGVTITHTSVAPTKTYSCCGYGASVGG